MAARPPRSGADASLTGASTVAPFGGLGREEGEMDANTILALGLGVTPPWKLVGQRLDTTVQPHILHLEVAVDRGSLFAWSCWRCTASAGQPRRHHPGRYPGRHRVFALRQASRELPTQLAPAPDQIPRGPASSGRKTVMTGPHR